MTQGERYTAVAIVLHWAIAAAILLNLFVGWWMHEAIDDPAMRTAAVSAFQLHKSVGLTVLVLTLLRLAWRLAHRPPPLPEAMRAWERVVARGVHWAFYVLMVILPLSGWLYVSTQWRDDAALNVPTLWFGLFEVPHLFGLDELAAETRKAVSHDLEEAHELLAWSMAGLLGLHVAAALKHRFVNRDGVLASMRPGVGAVVVVLATAAIVAAGQAGRAPAGAAAGGEISGVAGGWVVDAAASEIAYVGRHGEEFRGTFGRWQADLRFDPAAPQDAAIAATVDTASASDGDALRDQTLREREWFDVAHHPQASYRSTRLTPRGPGRWDLEGVLKIKTRELPVPALALVVEDGVLRIEGSFVVDREAADLGMESDPSGEYVGREVRVEVKVRATAP